MRRVPPPFSPQAEHAIFMTRNGRISMAGVTSSTVQRLAEAVHAVTKEQ